MTILIWNLDFLNTLTHTCFHTQTAIFDLQMTNNIEILNSLNIIDETSQKMVDEAHYIHCSESGEQHLHSFFESKVILILKQK